MSRRGTPSHALPMLPRRSTADNSGLSEEHLGYRVERRVHRLQLRGCLAERHRDDLVSSQRRHLSELALVDHVGGLHAEAGGEDAVEGGRSAAALDVAEDRDAGLVAGLRLDQVRELLPDAAQAHVAELVYLFVTGRFL